jgi:hypothetical protein
MSSALRWFDRKSDHAVMSNESSLAIQQLESGNHKSAVLDCVGNSKMAPRSSTFS